MLASMEIHTERRTALSRLPEAVTNLSKMAAPKLCFSGRQPKPRNIAALGTPWRPNQVTDTFFGGNLTLFFDLKQ
jgi:hypothetical protein